VREVWVDDACVVGHKYCELVATAQKQEEAFQKECVLLLRAVFVVEDSERVG